MTQLIYQTHFLLVDASCESLVMDYDVWVFLFFICAHITKYIRMICVSYIQGLLQCKEEERKGSFYYEFTTNQQLSLEQKVTEDIILSRVVQCRKDKTFVLGIIFKGRYE